MDNVTIVISNQEYDGTLHGSLLFFLQFSPAPFFSM